MIAGNLERRLIRRLEGMGLHAGLVVGGWTLERVARSALGDAALLWFARGSARVHVRLALSTPGVTRAGRLDLTHLPVEEALRRDAAELMTAIVARLSQRTPGADREGGAYAAESEPPELDPRRETPADRPFMRFLEIDAAEIDRFPDAIRQMYDGTLGGLLIKNVYAQPFMVEVMARLARRDADFPRTSFPARFRAHFYGRCLDGCDPELDEYLRDAARFRAELVPVFAGGAPYEARIEEALGALAGGRAVELPRFTDGRPYTPATIRILLEGGQIGTHCGNEAATRPAYTHLNTRIDRHDQISYFLTLQAPVAGGELIVYSLRWSDIDASRIVGGRSQVDELLRDVEWMAVRPAAGDLVIFDGGRYFHRVSKVVESRIRWTIGGFMMFAQGGEALYYWS